MSENRDAPNKDSNAGCPVSVGNNQICGETQTLAIIKEFKQLYEDKMRKVETEAGGDSCKGLKAKVSLQRDWIRDLTEQNEMLVRAVEELETEATDRVCMLEEKLRNSSQQGAEVMQKYRNFNFSINLDETFQKLVYLQSDVHNLLEFIKRARDEGKWSIDGLHFYNITCKELFGSPPCCPCCPCDQGVGDQKVQKQLKASQKPAVKEKESQLSTRFKEKDEELNAVKRSMLDMRNALTIEVAEKHDVILNLRRDVQQLEEKYRQANKQTQFKDDIIKEMRKEIKVLKSQVDLLERPKSRSTASSRLLEAMEPLPTFHKCCPYVKDLCPLNLRNNDIITHFKRSRDTLKHHVQENTDTNSVNQDKQAFTSLCEKNSPHDFPTAVQDGPALTTCIDKQFEINAQVTLTSKSHSPRPHKNMGNASSSESVPRSMLPQISFYSERSIPDSQSQQKPRSNLTSSTILHEYYGMKEKGDVFGMVENYNDSLKNPVTVPKHISVKKYVTNLEENAKEKTHSENKKDKKKVTMSGEDNFLKYTA